MTKELGKERYQEAMQLHAQIMASGTTAVRALVEFASLLKKMKDERLYEAFNQTFDEYVEKQVGIRKRQAYTYIAAFERLGAPMMEAHANLGITKLELLSQVPSIEREDALENNDFENMSAAEMKRFVDELNHKGEQLTFVMEENDRLRAELETAKTDPPNDTAGEENIDQMRAEIDRLRDEMQHQAKEAERAVKQAKAAASVEKAKAIKEAVSKALSDAAVQQSKKHQKELEDAKAKAAEEAEEKARIRYEQSNKSNEALRSEIETLKKKMSIAGNQDAVIVSSYCKTVLAKVLNELVCMIEGAKERNVEQGAKLAGAAAALLGNAQSQIASMAEAKT